MKKEETSITITLKQEIHNEAKILAVLNNETLKKFVSRAIKNEIKKIKAKKNKILKETLKEIESK